MFSEDIFIFLSRSQINDWSTKEPRTIFYKDKLNQKNNINENNFDYEYLLLQIHLEFSNCLFIKKAFLFTVFLLFAIYFYIICPLVAQE